MNTRSFLTLCVALTAAFTFTPAIHAQDADAAEAKANAMVKGESLGDLKVGLGEKELLALLGKPEKQGKVTQVEGDGDYVQVWKYPAKGLEITVTSGEKKTGAKTVASFVAGAGCKLATKTGIAVGSPVSDLKKAYAGFERDDSKGDGSGKQFVAGSIYSAIFFEIADGKVSRITF